MSLPEHPAPSPAARRPRRAARAGFTLVEVLIVVVILAILAATVLPQFSNASGDAADGALKQNLHTVRSQIELFRVQHNNKLPGNSTDTFVEQMLNKTNRAGVVGTGAEHVYGPYVSADAFPANPFNELNAVSVVAGDPVLVAEDNTDGWVYSKKTGEFRAQGDATRFAW